MTNVKKDDKKRLSLSVFAAIFLHFLVFAAFVRLIPLSLSKPPDYVGPISVTVSEYEQPVPREKTAPIRVSEKAPSVSSAHVSEERASPKKSWARPASPRTRDDSARQEVTRNLVPVPAEEAADVAAPDLKAPESTTRNDKQIPFRPGTEVSEAPLALNLQKLDETLDKTRRGEGGSSIDKSPKTGPGTASGPTGSPIISWEDAGVQRSLISAGPSPDIPQWVKREGIDLKVMVSFSVTAGGQTTLVSTALSSGYSDVDSAVLDSVRKMKFNPAPGAGLARGTVSYIIRTK